MIFRQGEKPTGIYCVSSGAVKLSRLDSDGSVLLLRAYGAGETLGYSALYSDDPQPATAVAQENCEVCFIPDSLLRRLLEADLPLTLGFLKQMNRELHEIEERAASMISHPTSQRVAEAVLLLKKCAPASNWTRKDIADWAGTTPETVMRILAQFESKKLIEQNGRSIKILDHQGLCRTAILQGYPAQT